MTTTKNQKKNSPILAILLTVQQPSPLQLNNLEAAVGAGSQDLSSVTQLSRIAH
jgi:hypothetical protein